ncbi:hypothetical protein BJY59DRAFT_706429 [Rhodotorula toruloides]
MACWRLAGKEMVGWSCRWTWEWASALRESCTSRFFSCNPSELAHRLIRHAYSEDTDRIIVGTGMEDLFLDMPVEQAQDFVKKRIAIVEKRVAEFDEPIARLKEEHAKLVETLQSAFGGQSGQIRTLA